MTHASLIKTNVTGNMGCKFCFHTAKTGTVLEVSEAKRGLRMLRDAGMEKLTIVGGEPFLLADVVGEVVTYAKRTLGVTTCIVSNGSLIKEKWFKDYDLDVLGLSCDSFAPSTNAAHGRVAAGLSGPDHVDQIFRVRHWADTYGVKFKLNTVVTALNHDEDMNDPVARLQPFRWKVFQCLLLDGENKGGPEDLRDARDLVVHDKDFKAFVDRHSSQPSLVPETNEQMQDSYLMSTTQRHNSSSDSFVLRRQSLFDAGWTSRCAGSTAPAARNKRGPCPSSTIPTKSSATTPSSTTPCSANEVASTTGPRPSPPLPQSPRKIPNYPSPGKEKKGSHPHQRPQVSPPSAAPGIISRHLS